jgi:hypothetical protein
VEDRDEKTGTDPEIEAHRWKKAKANDEGPMDGDDVEAHKKKATSEPGSDESDDVELHRKRLK